MDIDNRLRSEMKNFSINGKNRAITYAVYAFMLINASYADGEKTKRGQLLSSSYMISKELGLTRSQVRTAVDKLIAAKLISKKSTRHYTIFTLLNYDKSGKPKQAAKNDRTDDDDSKSEADREYYEYLRREIRTRELNDEERRFFNSYYD